MLPSIPASRPANRARVRKACQRCKVRKTRCNGDFPCQKCKEADELCVYNPIRQMKSRPKPRGYTEMLEEQQNRLASGLRRMYRRLRKAQLWDGPELIETEGQPSILHIMEELNRIDPPTDNEGSTSPNSVKESAIETEEMPGGGHDMSFDQAAIELMEFEPISLPLIIDPMSEMFNMIDWGAAKVCTPLATETLAQDSDMSSMSADMPSNSAGLRNYSFQMMEAQAQQARLAGLAPTVASTNLSIIFS